jgi:hypothetical protein
MSGQHVKSTAEATNSRDRKKRKKSLNAPAAAAAEDASRPSGRKSLTSAGTRPKCRPAADDIDGIFAGQARKRTAQARPAPQGQADALGAAELTQQHTKAGAAKQLKRPSSADKGSKDDIFGEGPAKARRVDEEGLPVYSTEELNVGQGGNSAACPFDCECCF